MKIFGITFEKGDKEKKTTPVYNTSWNDLNQDLKIVGNIKSKSNLRVACILQGNIKCENKVVITAQAEVEGSIISENIEIYGSVTGTFENKDSAIILGKNSRFVGNIVAKTVVVEGTHTGDITAEVVKIHSSAIMKGKITTEVIAIAQNNNLEVEFKMVKKEQELKVEKV